MRVMRIIARMNVGGPALQVSTLLQDLDPTRFEQRLYVGAPDPREGDYRELRAADLPVYLVPGLGRSVRPADDIRALASLSAAIRDFRPDLVHTHTAKAGALGRIAAAATRVPIRVHTFHGHLLHSYFSPARTALLVRAERGLARTTHQLVAVSTRVRDDLLAAGIGRADQYSIIPPGVALTPPPSRDDARRALELTPAGPVVAFVGRVTGVKRPDRMLEVARAVRQQLPTVQFVVCGDGDRLEATIARAAADGLDLKFLRWRADVETVYAAADVVLLTSDNEGTPVSLIEAGLAGRPVVATNVGGVAEVVRHGVTGWLTAPDPELLSSALLTLLRDDALRGRLGRAAAAWTSERYGRQRLVADTEKLYQRLAADRDRSTTATVSQPGPAGDRARHRDSAR